MSVYAIDDRQLVELVASPDDASSLVRREITVLPPNVILLALSHELKTKTCFLMSSLGRTIITRAVTIPQGDRRRVPSSVTEGMVMAVLAHLHDLAVLSGVKTWRSEQQSQAWDYLFRTMAHHIQRSASL